MVSMFHETAHSVFVRERLLTVLSSHGSLTVPSSIGSLTVPSSQGFFDCSIITRFL